MSALKRLILAGAAILAVPAFASPPEYVEDTAADANPAGNITICVRRDTLTAAEVTTDGDNVAVKCDSKGELYIKATDSDALLTSILAGNGDADDATWPGSGDGTNNGVLKGIYGLAASTAPSAVNANIGTSAPIRIVSAAASTNLTQISDSACTVMRISGYNARASAVFIRLYNIADQSVTVGTSATYWSVEIPATTAFSIPVEQTFATACSLAMTTGSADNDTGALTAADILHLAVTYR